MCDLVTRDWLKTVIESSCRHGAGRRVHICSFKAARALSKGENYASLTFRCPVVYRLLPDDDDGSGPSAGARGSDEERDERHWQGEERRVDLFMKLMPSGKEHAAIMEEFGAFKREAQVYESLLPDMRTLVDAAGAPQDCYPDAPVNLFTKGSGPDSAVVMEDLGCYGYRVGNRYDGVTEEEARHALRAFAKFHANSIALARSIGPDYESRYPLLADGPFEASLMKKFMQDDNKEFAMVEEALRAVPGEEARADRVKAYLDTRCPIAREKYVEFRKYLKKGHTLSGFMIGDCWVNNMMFRREEQEDGSEKIVAVKLLDYQLVEPGSPFPDLFYFIGSSTDKVVRSKTRELLERDYFPELVRVLGLLGIDLAAEGYAFDDFWNDFRGGREYPLVAAFFLLPIVMANKEDLPDYDTGDLTVEDFNAATKHVLQAGSGAKVLARFSDLVQDLIDDGVI